MQFECATAILRMRGLKAGAFEIGREDIGDFRFVFGDQDQCLISG